MMIKINKKWLPVVFVFALLVGSAGYIKYQQSKISKLSTEIDQLKKDPQSVAKEEVKALTDQVSKLVVLPEGEDPIVATVTDKDKLKDQPVFAKAENGDKILIYSNAKKAYIFRPSKNVIVDVLPVNLGNTSPAIAGVDASKPLKVVLVNGTSTPNLTSVLEKRIVDNKITGIQVTNKATAKSTDYKRTLVVDLTGKLGDQAKQLAALIDGEVATQTSEIKPNADLMVIIGANFK